MPFDYNLPAVYANRGPCQIGISFSSVRNGVTVELPPVQVGEFRLGEFRLENSGWKIQVGANSG